MTAQGAITRKSFGEKRIEGFSLGAFFIWIGLCWIFSFPPSVPLFGVAFIVFGAQVARIIIGRPPQGFWLFFGFILVLTAFVQQFKTQVNLVPIFLVAVGVLVVMRQVKAYGREKNEKNEET